MNKIVLIFLSVFMFASLSSEAQFLDRLAREAVRQAERSAEERATKEVQKEVDKQVNKAIDDIVESDSTSMDQKKANSEPTLRSDSERASAIMGALGISTADIDFKNQYVFTSFISTISESVDADGNAQEPVESDIFMNADSKDVMFEVRAENQMSNTIFDSENKCMLILTQENGKKTGMATKIDVDDSQDDVEAERSQPEETVPVPVSMYAEDDDDCLPQKTGKSKTISGFKCYEYRCETDEEIDVIWTTKDVKFDKKLSGLSWVESLSNSVYDGMIIRYENYSKMDKSSTVTTITSVDYNKKNIFSAGDYEISSLSFTPNK
jgi:hypothetical protein